MNHPQEEFSRVSIIGRRPAVNIYEYWDYRKYLSEYIVAWKEFNKNVSFGWISKKIGLPNSRGFLKYVIAGNKDIGGKTAQKIVELLRLTHDETKYFRALVLFNQCRDVGEKELYFNALARLNKAPREVLAKSQMELFKNWLPNLVLCALDCVSFKGNNYGCLIKFFKVPVEPEDLKEAVSLLKSLKLIKLKEKEWKPAAEAWRTPPNMQSELVKNYHIQLMDITKASILQTQSPERLHKTITFSISRPGLKKINAILEDAAREVNSIIKNDKNSSYTGTLSFHLTPFGWE